MEEVICATKPEHDEIFRKKTMPQERPTPFPSGLYMGHCILPTDDSMNWDWIIQEIGLWSICVLKHSFKYILICWEIELVKEFQKKILLDEKVTCS